MNRLSRAGRCAALIFAAAVCLSPCGCAKDKGGIAAGFEYGLSVSFLDVGEGDSIYITFPDGKNMLIDSGAESERNAETVSNAIKTSDKDSLDYFVLTHTDGDHTGNAAETVLRFPADKAFLPDVKNVEKFYYYSEALKALEKCGAETVYSQTFCTLRGEGYFFTFLSPLASEFPESAYSDLNAAVIPTEEQLNAISAVIYLEYAGVRFLFTGDATVSAEKLIMKYYSLGLYGKDNAVNLDNVDFLKVSHHGSADASHEDFLRLVKPHNAVISVGGNNYYGHPSSKTLARLLEVNPDCEFWRTDRDGTVCVFVGSDGKTVVKTEAEINA